MLKIFGPLLLPWMFPLDVILLNIIYEPSSLCSGVVSSLEWDFRRILKWKAARLQARRFLFFLYYTMYVCTYVMSVTEKFYSSFVVKYNNVHLYVYVYNCMYVGRNHTVLYT